MKGSGEIELNINLFITLYLFCVVSFKLTTRSLVTDSLDMDSLGMDSLGMEDLLPATTDNLNRATDPTPPTPHRAPITNGAELSVTLTGLLDNC